MKAWIAVVLVMALLPGVAVAQGVTNVPSDYDRSSAIVDYLFSGPMGVLEQFGTNSISEGRFEVDAVIKALRDQGDIAELVNKLVASGDICAVRGHHWASTRILYQTLEYRPDGDYPVHRECRLCGKTETKQPEEWR